MSALFLDDALCWTPHVEPWHSLLSPYPDSLLFDQPPSPTDTCASFASSSSSSSWSPPPRPTHVVCNAPLLMPRPLPYHSPTFLTFESLPEIEDDLSYPPYTTRSRTAAKRKRAAEDDHTARQQQKRRLNASAVAAPPQHVAYRRRPTRTTTRANMPRR
ncbi:hypothetical protein HMN09_00034500 [Mycena chlorophos]|uniref:Uncharacterized protein n=1 Tax=Mycena chlorophos TaxID=658473 RepID=A0A8H6TRR4_MYCCL|nr:hypothetical protein HMN09_00034500 [Mycena chlorophos]